VGISIILAGILSGVFFVVQNQTSFLTQASPDSSPKNITLSNIEDTSATISWQSTTSVPGFISLGIDGGNKAFLDDRDSTTPTPRKTHHVTLKKLKSQSTYKYKVFSGKTITPDLTFTTAYTSTPNSFNPVIGSVLNSNDVVKEGVVYLTISGLVTQSGVIKDQGNFIIPISAARQENLFNIFKPTEGEIAKLTLLSEEGGASALFRLNNLGKPLESLRVGQDLDLTIEIPPELEAIYDLDNNKIINAADYSILVTNFGKNPKNLKADLYKDNEVDKKDLDLMIKKMSELGQPIPTQTPSP